MHCYYLKNLLHHRPHTLEYVEDGDEGYFQNIDDEDEFERVSEYIESLAEEVEEG